MCVFFPQENCGSKKLILFFIFLFLETVYFPSTYFYFAY